MTSIKIGNTLPDEPTVFVLKAPAAPSGYYDSIPLTQAPMAQVSLRDHCKIDLDASPSAQHTVQPEPFSLGDQNPEGVQRDGAILSGDNESSIEDSESSSLPPRIPLSPSPQISNSSEEIVVFTGRSAPRCKTKSSPTATRSVQRKKSSSQVEHDLERIRLSNRSTIDAVNDPVIERKIPMYLPGRNSPTNFSPLALAHIRNVSLKCGPSRRTSRASLRTQMQAQQLQKSKEPARWESQEDAILSDYIANISGKGSIGHLENDQDANNPWIEVPVSDLADEPRIKSDDSTLLQGLMEKGPYSMFDLNRQSTSSEKDFEVNKVLSKRHGRPGTQHLVLEEGRGLDHIRWLSSSSVSALITVEAICDTKRE